MSKGKADGAPRCEFCGRFGGRRLVKAGQYAGRSSITVYECWRCEAKHDAAAAVRAKFAPPVPIAHVNRPGFAADCNGPNCVKVDGYSSHAPTCPRLAEGKR